MEQLVKIELVRDNPYQGRTTYKDIESLGKSIAAEDIQEKPKARVSTGSTTGKKNAEYELKFGHRRLRAFLWLKDNFKALGLAERYDGYTVMPLDIEELTDEEMNRGVIVENAQREDLTVIEEARMMRDYGTRWNKTSEQIGEVFGKSGATVRGIIRLLELPEAVQDKIASGEISQGAARKLLTIARVDESQIASAVKSFAAGESAEDVIEDAMRRSESAFAMHNSWSHETPRAGQGLWLLDTKAEKFPSAHLPELKAENVAKALELELTADLKSKIEDYMESAKRSPEFVSQFGEKHRDTNDVELMERIGHLLTPPSCAGCVFHAVADRTHYCGFKACHARKRTAWVRNEMEKISKKLKIAIYDPTKDGKTILALQESTYNDDGKKHAKLVEANDPDLRLQPHKNDYSEHKWTASNLVRVILVGAKVAATKEKKAEANNSRQAEEEKQRKQDQLERARNEASHKFLKDYAVKLFGVAFKGLENVPAMCALARVNAPKKDAKKADALSALHAELARDALNNLNGLDWQLYRSGPVALAKFLAKVAPTWGVKLPADFMDMAKGYEPVAAETPAAEKKGKKK